MRILVTGGAGFIGSHLCERLVARGDDVVAVDNFDPFYDPAVKRRNLAALEGDPRFRLVEGDVCEPEALGVEPRIRRLPAQPGDVARTFASIDKARSLLGYDPRVPIEEGIRRFVRWLGREGAVPA